MAPSVDAVRDPGLQPERTALSWRRTIMSAVVADLLIWRAWFQALAGDSVDGLAAAGHGNADQLVGLGICAAVASLTTIILVFCAVSRIRLLHAGVGSLESEAHVAVPAPILRTASAAIVALAAAAMFALALGM